MHPRTYWIGTVAFAVVAAACATVPITGRTQHNIQSIYIGNPSLALRRFIMTTDIIKQYFLATALCAIIFFEAPAAYAEWHCNCHSGPAGTTCYSPCPWELRGPDSPPPPDPTYHYSDVEAAIRQLFSEGQFSAAMTDVQRADARGLRRWIAANAPRDSPASITAVTASFMHLAEYFAGYKNAYTEATENLGRLHQAAEVELAEVRRLNANTQKYISVSQPDEQQYKDLRKKIGTLQQQIGKAGEVSFKVWAEKISMVAQAFASAQLAVPGDLPPWLRSYSTKELAELKAQQKGREEWLAGDIHDIMIMPTIETANDRPSIPTAADYRLARLPVNPDYIRWFGTISSEHQRDKQLELLRETAAAIDKYVASDPQGAIARAKSVRRELIDARLREHYAKEGAEQARQARINASSAVKKMRDYIDGRREEVIFNAATLALWKTLNGMANTAAKHLWIPGRAVRFARVQADIIGLAKDEISVMRKGVEALAHGDARAIQEIEKELHDIICRFANDAGFDAFPLPDPVGKVWVTSRHCG
jgi:hypothetical protein